MSAPCPVFGFTLQFRLASGANDLVLVDALTRDVIEPRSLSLLGRTAPGYMVRGDGLQATDADRQAVIAWLEERRDLASFTVGPIVDLAEG